MAFKDEEQKPKTKIDPSQMGKVKRGITSGTDDFSFYSGLQQLRPKQKGNESIKAKVGKVTVKPAEKPAAKTIGKIANVIKKAAPTSKPMGGLLPEVTVKGQRIYKDMPTQNLKEVSVTAKKVGKPEKEEKATLETGSHTGTYSFDPNDVKEHVRKNPEWSSVIDTTSNKSIKESIDKLDEDDVIRIGKGRKAIQKFVPTSKYNLRYEIIHRKRGEKDYKRE